MIFDLNLQFQVAKLFSKIQEMVEEEDNLVFVLIGESFDDIFSFCAGTTGYILA